ncbi:hypothetical protein IJO12_04920 [bacterium]|nr:hypothetical protein [bacterium]
MFDRKKILTILFALLIAAAVAFCIFRKDFSSSENIEKPNINNEQIELNEIGRDEIFTINNEENKEDIKVNDTKSTADKKEIQDKKNFDMKEAVDDVENKTAEISDDVEKELTVGEMFKNRKFINDNIPQTRPRADVVLINEEIKVATPEKYSFK